LQDVIDTWYGRVFAFCQSQLRSRCDAEDAAQETFLRAIRFDEKLGQNVVMGAWLRQVARNVCVDVIRRNQRRECDELPSDSIPITVGNDPSLLSADHEEQQRLVSLVHQLDEDLREVVLLHYYDELSYDQIAQWLDVSRSTVNERLAKARRKLRSLLNHEGYHNEVR
jgi:RNA polymerase sigma-70 factor, ECF subfamily